MHHFSTWFHVSIPQLVSWLVDRYLTALSAQTGYSYNPRSPDGAT